MDTAHWCAYLVVLVAVARRAGDWERLLNAHLAVGLCVGAFAALRLSVPEAGLGLWGPEPRWPRISGTTGNPTFLGGYLQGVALLAAGFLARSAAGGAAAARASPRPGRWAARGFWLAAACCALAGLAASGTLGALAGLGAGAAAAGALYAWLGATPGERRAGRLGLAALAGAALVLAAVVALRPGDAPERGRRGGGGRRAARTRDQRREHRGAARHAAAQLGGGASRVRRPPAARLGTGELLRRLRPPHGASPGRTAEGARPRAQHARP